MYEGSKHSLQTGRKDHLKHQAEERTQQLKPLVTAEEQRLAESRQRDKHWKRWGPYLSERAWGTVREDYSPHGSAWDYFPHEHARSKAYRWGEDGIGGISDRQQYLCFAIALWNGRDPFLLIGSTAAKPLLRGSNANAANAKANRLNL